jgi:hypothetical protein
MEEVAGGWRRLHNEKLPNLYASQNIRVINSRRISWAGHVARMEATTYAYNFLVGKPDGKRPFGRLRRRCEDNIRMDLRKPGW